MEDNILNIKNSQKDDQIFDRAPSQFLSSNSSYKSNNFSQSWNFKDNLRKCKSTHKSQKKLKIMKK